MERHKFEGKEERNVATIGIFGVPYKYLSFGWI
jgi:hypothetical protein